MADPLSVAAGVVGLITAAAQVSSILSELISKTRHAPSDCEKLRQEVDDIHGVLGQLQLFVSGAHRPSRSRTSLIMVDQVVATLAACVTTFSELDCFVEGLRSESSMDLLDRLRWAAKEKDLKGVLVRLQRHKNSLTLMLGILTCQKQVEAERKVDRLCELVQQTLDQNVMLATRLAAYENDQVPTDAKREPMTKARDSVGEAQDQSCDLHSPSSDPVESSKTVQTVSTQELEGKAYGFAFEEQLMTSRPYRATSSDGSDACSLVSAAGRTMAWSTLSGLSLSEISHIAILALPIYASDIKNLAAYDFEYMLPETAAELDRQTPQRQVIMIPASRRQRWMNLVRARPSPLPEKPTVIFGVPIHQSILYGGVHVTLTTANGCKLGVGDIPTVVARTGRFIKANDGPNTPNIFATNGNAARVMRLQQIFESPSDYGRSLKWTGFTVHDAASTLLRYLKALPEPVIPYGHYDLFTSPCRPDYADKDLLKDDNTFELIRHLHGCIVCLPDLSKSLLYYLADLFAIIGSNVASNQVSVARLVGIAQPALLSRPPSEMNPEEHDLTIGIMTFLIENCDVLFQGHITFTEPIVRERYG